MSAQPYPSIFHTINPSWRSENNVCLAAQFWTWKYTLKRIHVHSKFYISFKDHNHSRLHEHGKYRSIFSACWIIYVKWTRRERFQSYAVSLEGRNEYTAILIRLKSDRERKMGGKRESWSNLSCFAKSVSLRADRVACRRGKLPRSATNKVVQGGTTRLKRYYARDTKVRYRLRDFVEIARAPLDRIN